MGWYAVRKGRKTGVFSTWDECQQAVNGYTNAEFKKFATFEDAEAYLEDRDLWEEHVAADNSQGYLVAFTDGSYKKELRRYSYGVKLICPDGTNDELCGFGDNEEYVESMNIVGEVFGVINALDWAISNSYDKIKIYHDYEGISKWISGEWNAKSGVALMFKHLFDSKFKDLLEVVFEKVPGHCNIRYNCIADSLARAALANRKYVPISGDNWYSVPNISKDDFEALIKLVEENNVSISHEVLCTSTKDVYKLSLGNDSLTVTLYKSSNHKLLMQGKNTNLFQIVTTSIVELFDNRKVEKILGDAYRVSIEEDRISEPYAVFERSVPGNYPAGIKRLIRQSIINLSYFIESDDYSMIVFPALRALEGHMKYLIVCAGGTPDRQFRCFGKQGGRYIVTEHFPNSSYNNRLEICFNYYKAQRDTIFHFGDLIGLSDNTRFITKSEADEIIKKCIDLVINNQ